MRLDLDTLNDFVKSSRSSSSSRYVTLMLDRPLFAMFTMLVIRTVVVQFLWLLWKWICLGYM